MCWTGEHLPQCVVTKNRIQPQTRFQMLWAHVPSELATSRVQYCFRFSIHSYSWVLRHHQLTSLMVDITDASAKLCKCQRDKSKQTHLSQNGPTCIIGSFPFASNRCNPNDDPIIRTTDSASIKGVPLEHVEPTHRMHILQVILLHTNEHWSSLQLRSTMKLMNQIMKEATEVHLTAAHYKVFYGSSCDIYLQ